MASRDEEAAAYIRAKAGVGGELDADRGSRRRPPRAGLAVAVAVVIVACGLLAHTLDMLVASAMSAIGAVSLTTVVWLASSRRLASPRTWVAVVALPPTGLVLLAGIGYILVAQYAQFLPVGTVFVIAGVTIAAFGGASLLSDTVDYGAMKTTALVTVGALVPTVLVTGAVVGRVTVREMGISLVPAFAVDPLLAPVLAPEATGPPPLGDLLVVWSIAAVLTGRAARRLPLRAFLDDGTEASATTLARFDRVVDGLGHGKYGLVIGAIVAGMTYLVPVSLTWRQLPPVVVALASTVSTAPLLRQVAVAIICIAVCALLVSRGVPYVYRSDLRASQSVLAILAGVGTALGAGWLGHATLIAVLLDGVTGVLPSALAATLRMEVDAVVAYYGGPTIAVTILAVGTLVVALIVLTSTLLLMLRLVPRTGTGYSVTSLGLLLAGTFSIPVNAPLHLSLGTLVAAVLVWDLGQYGVELGADVGRRAPSLAPQLVHTGGAAFIGIVTAGGAVALLSVTGAIDISTSSTAFLSIAASIGTLSLLGLGLSR